MMVIKQRAQNAMLGLAIGDALSWTSLFHRGVLLPPWTRRKRREIDALSETTNVIVTPMPFSLNQPSEYFTIAPTDKTEWAAFSSYILLGNGFHSYNRSVLQAWLKLAQSKDPIRGGVSTQAALHNLRNGILPPQSGKENPHYFDDGAMSRAIPIGIICAGQPDIAARIAEIDAAVTNSEDGIWAAQSIAVLISMLCSGKEMKDAIEIALHVLPAGSWIRRIVDEVLTISAKCNSIFSILPKLHDTIINREYSYGNAAPETLALTFVIAQLHHNNFETAVTTSSAFAKSGETLPAMVGAVVAAAQSTNIASQNWMEAIGTLKGICIPSYTGKNYLELTDQISNMTGQKILL
ncbi:MAG: ADP-ribosylglycohydrolase family protein [Bacteroidota bacterium]